MFRGGSGGKRKADRDGISSSNNNNNDGSIQDNLASLTQQDDNQENSDDDNAAPDMESEFEESVYEDPLLLAIDDLEGRVVTCLDDVKVHSGVRSSSSGGSVLEEIATLLRPVLEVAAHTAPSVARTYYRGGAGAEGVEESCADVYQRVVSDLVYPVILEMAQSDRIPAKRSAALEFFRQLYRECHKSGSWLDLSPNSNAGPYGAGGASSSHQGQAAQARSVKQRRQATRLDREGELLRYWVQASIACTLPGVFTSTSKDASVAARGVLAASASIRPSLKHIAHRIRDADDRGANRIYAPVMKMVQGVFKKLFLVHNSTNESTSMEGDALQSACLKFLEIVCLCCSIKPPDPTRRRRGTTPDDFSLTDLPAGHPVITQEALESVGEFTFACLRGFTLLGGQVKMDTSLLSSTDSSSTPSKQIVSLLKPAALVYLEMESTLPKGDDEDGCLRIEIDRAHLDFDFLLSPKSYLLAINAVAALATNRPRFFKDGATCLARRTADPPVFVEDVQSPRLPRNSVLAICNQLKASCLTLLRNAVSVQTKSSFILHKVLAEKLDMQVQADKALKMATQAHNLKTAGRAERNRVNMFYEWESADPSSKSAKRQRETDDALAELRSARASRGLGQGIQLPTSMVDAMELVVANLTHLPSKRPTGGASTRGPSSAPVNVDYLVDAVLSNGESLVQEEGLWYSRGGGGAWSNNDGTYSLSTHVQSLKPVEQRDTEPTQSKSSKETDIFQKQCRTAAGDALGRILLNGASRRDAKHSQFADSVAARLAWTLDVAKAPTRLTSAMDTSMDAIQIQKKSMPEPPASSGENAPTTENGLDELSKTHPLVCACIGIAASGAVDLSSDEVSSISLSNAIMNEAYVRGFSETLGGTQPESTQENWQYLSSLELWSGTIIAASKQANKATDPQQKRVATKLSADMPKQLSTLPELSVPALSLLGLLGEVGPKASKKPDATRNQADSIASAAAVHAAKHAADKRGTLILLALRDAIFQRSNHSARTEAIDAVTAIAAGRITSNPAFEDKALKLLMNVLYPRSNSLANDIVVSATKELQMAAELSIKQYPVVQDANTKARKKEKDETRRPSPNIPESDEEKEVMDAVRKPIVLFMALCIRQPDLIKTLFEVSSQQNANTLSKTVRQQMPKLARAAGTKHGLAEIALQVAEIDSETESTLLLAFLDNLAPLGNKEMAPQFVEACLKIQEAKSEVGKKDSRFIIPVVASMKRSDLVNTLPEFVLSDDGILLAALEKMSMRLARQALLFREEPENEEVSLMGMTACEQLVFLHKQDFEAAKMPRKRHLDVLRLCLENEELYNDRLIMSALDHMSGTFLTENEKLPLAYMRTVIMACTKHESLHSWICSTLLPRLVEGKIYEERRLWEGWMRCAKMLENNGDTGVSSAEALRLLPPEQQAMYQKSYGSS